MYQTKEKISSMQKGSSLVRWMYEDIRRNMKFYVSITVHQRDSTQPDYQQLHNLLMEAGFLQRGLDGILTLQPTSGLYQREDTVLSRADIEFDLRAVLDSFPHRCSFQLEQAASTTQAGQQIHDAPQNRIAEAIRTAQLTGTLVQ